MTQFQTLHRPSPAPHPKLVEDNCGEIVGERAEVQHEDGEAPQVSGGRPRLHPGLPPRLGGRDQDQHPLQEDPETAVIGGGFHRGHCHEPSVTKALGTMFLTCIMLLGI